MTNLEGMPIYKARLSKAQRGGAELRKIVFASSSAFSRILMVPQNQREFFENWGFVFTIKAKWSIASIQTTKSS